MNREVLKILVDLKEICVLIICTHQIQQECEDQNKTHKQASDLLNKLWRDVCKSEKDSKQNFELL